jgi:mitochondrial fission protein ELM1
MADAAPRIWILVTDKAGDAAQLRALARAAGLAAEEKQLAFNGLARLPNLLCGATRAGLRDTKSSPLEPPWPELVLSSGRRSVPVARWIRRQSGGKTLLAHVGRPWGRLRWFDLMFAMPQYGLPDRPNVFQARMPFNALAPAAIDRGVANWAPRLAGRRRPFIAVLLGGSARPLVFDADTARALGQSVAARARAIGGTVLLSTSRRTPRAAAEAAIAPLDRDNDVIYRFRPDDPDNPYAAFVTLADEIVVTGDSASMLAEALRSGKKVAVAPLPLRPDLRRRAADFWRAVLPAPLFALLVDLGLVASTRDLGRLQDRLRRERLIGAPGQPTDGLAPLDDDLPRAASRLRALLAAHGRLAS